MQRFRHFKGFFVNLATLKVAKWTTCQFDNYGHFGQKVKRVDHFLAKITKFGDFLVI